MTAPLKPKPPKITIIKPHWTEYVFMYILLTLIVCAGIMNCIILILLIAGII